MFTASPYPRQAGADKEKAKPLMSAAERLKRLEALRALNGALADSICGAPEANLGVVPGVPRFDPSS
jgi:hypothetical protein